MTHQDAIAVLTSVAQAATARDSMRALSRARRVLGDSLEVYEPLLNTLAQRATEMERLERLAGCDALTGVANRRTFEQAMEREVSRYGRTGEPFSLILLDLDELKPLNDAHGHAAGDEAIIALARACEDVIRSTDLAARFGGDEFAVLLPGSDMRGARTFARRIRERIESCEIEGIALRVSIGVASANGMIDSCAGALAAADADLYRDKHKRRRDREQRAA